MKNKLLIFNWKMNPVTLQEALDLARASDKKNVVVAPPFVFLERIGKILKNAELGAQDLFWENPPAGGGAFTGEISASMLKNISVKYMIIGHSERRQYLGETDEIISKKVKTAIENKLIPILCVGEIKRRGKGKEEREKQAMEIIKNQLQKDLVMIHDSRFMIQEFIVAYEPVWAIGTGIPCKPEEAARIHRLIRKFLDSRFKIRDLRIIYGGSVDSKNIEDLMKCQEIEGVLVGGASLKIDEVRKIIKKCKI
jgi:triosephosphate isomerase